jgi:tetratricopeptide (TPR) repeat protein
LVFKNFKRSSGQDPKQKWNWQEKNTELVALIRSNRIDEAVELGQAIVEWVDRAYRKDAPEKATTYSNMGMAYMLIDDYELADKCFRESLEMRKRIFGNDHNEVGVILLNMVRLYKIQADRIFAANRVETKVMSDE